MRKTNKLIIASLTCLVTLFSGPLQAGEEEKPSLEQVLTHPEVQGALAAIDAWIEGKRHYDRVPGISAGVVVDQDMLWTSGYGYSNLETQRPADADTLYSICSISKLFTSIGVMQMRDAGKLKLYDPVSNYLEWYNINQAHEGSPAVTIEGLLTHSSGLPRESDFHYWNGPDFPFPSREEMMARLGEQETLYPASQHFQYSNLALSLAGEILSEVSGEEYQAYIKQHILSPLGLQDTRSFYPEDLRGEQLAIGYTGVHHNSEREVVAPFFARGITPAAGFTSSVNDLGRFASWQFKVLEGGGDKVLSTNTLREMQRVHWVDPDWETTWGLGFNVRREGDNTLVGHSGGCPGYITHFVMVPKEKVAAIALTNAGDGPSGSISKNILEVILPALDEAETASEDEIPDLSMYEGNFETKPWGGETAIRQWGKKLAAIDIPSDKLSKAINKLEHVEGNIFVRLTDDDEKREHWRFEMDGDGKAVRVNIHSFHMDRIE